MLKWSIVSKKRRETSDGALRPCALQELALLGPCALQELALLGPCALERPCALQACASRLLFSLLPYWYVLIVKLRRVDQQFSFQMRARARRAFEEKEKVFRRLSCTITLSNKYARTTRTFYKKVWKTFAQNFSTKFCAKSPRKRGSESISDY